MGWWCVLRGFGRARTGTPAGRNNIWQSFALLERWYRNRECIIYARGGIFPHLLPLCVCLSIIIRRDRAVGPQGFVYFFFVTREYVSFLSTFPFAPQRLTFKGKYFIFRSCENFPPSSSCAPRACFIWKLSFAKWYNVIKRNKRFQNNTLKRFPRMCVKGNV